MLNIARKPNRHTMRIRMRVKLEGVFFFFFFLCLLLLANNIVAASVPFNRTLFPECFVFGAGSGAYQMEGAANIDGRGPSIWDTFTHQHPEKIADRSNGDVAVDFYHRYKSDIKLMKKVGLDSYRFSISWSRIFPEGKGKVNDLGVNFYNNLINELLSKGITPIVTLFYWDVPQALEDKYGGFLSRKLVNDFRNYADFCFKIFGDRVKNWVTFNEPFEFINDAYNVGTFAPSRCSNYVANCTAGDSATEPYIVGHHLLLSHAAAVRLYKKKYQASQKGQIGISLVTNWFEPKNNTPADREAADRAQDFWFGWHAHPITYGDYPESMKSLVGDRLPKLTKAESKFVKGTYDFLGLNYYTSAYIEYAPPTTTNKSLSSDMQATLSFFKNGVPIGTPTEMVWIFNYPEGLRKLLVYIKDKYQNPPIYITENGVGQINNASKSVQEAIKDNMRITYHENHLRSLLQAIKDGVNVKRYYILSFLDGFDWTGGYTSRYGLTYVDYKNNLARHLKNSAYWFKKFLLK